MVIGTCNPNYSVGWSRRIAWTWEVEVVVSQWAGSEPRSRHCTLAWATRVKFHLKKKRVKCNQIDIPFIRQRLSNWTRKEHSYIFPSQESHFKYNDTGRYKRMKKNSNTKKTKTRVITLKTDKLDFYIKNISKYKDGLSQWQKHQYIKKS